MAELQEITSGLRFPEGPVCLEDGSVLVKKSVPVGYEQVRAKMPALVTVSNEVGELRYYPYGETRYTSGSTPTSRRRYCNFRLRFRRRMRLRSLSVRIDSSLWADGWLLFP